jgi:hypothetical protein
MTFQTTIVRWRAWDYADQGWLDREVSGYSVEAIDGSIGKIDQATKELNGSYLIVDTGPWIFGKKVMLPAGVVSSIDHQNKQVLVKRTKDQIKNAPEFDESMIADTSYRERLGNYYGEGGAGWYSGS